jgi:hypothetical protein
MRQGVVWLTLVVAIAVALAGASGAAARDAGVSYLANGSIRVGVDLDDGGKITYLAGSRVPAADLIDGVQQSYYDGNWHVAAAGGLVVAAVNDGRTIYTKVVPNADDGRPCTCVFETWVTLQGSSVQVVNRLTSDRSDKSPQPPSWQELPALYTAGTAYRLFTYDGAAPYTGAPVRRINGHPGRFFAPGSSFAATEHWAALVGTGGRGVGLFVPELTRFSGIPGTSAGVEQAGPNGYVTATTPEILDGPVVYAYRYALVLGTVRQIRAYAVSHRPDDRPDYSFRTGRRHWWHLNAADEGSPRGALRTRLEHDDPQLIGPEQRWEAKRAPLLYVRGAWHTRQSLAEVYWSAPGRRFDARRNAVVSVIPDGRFHTYRIRLAASRLYAGTVGGLRLDPVETQDLGGFVDLSCISWKPCPVDRAREAELERERLPYPFREDFEHGLGPIWHTSGSGTGATVATANGRLEVSVRATAANGPPGGWIGAHIGTNCRLLGDFDVQVDYDLLTWPATNGVGAFMNTYYGPAPNWESITRESLPWAEAYEARIAAFSSSVLTQDLRGTMRLTRSGGVLTASARTPSTDWQTVATRAAVTEPAVITVGAASNDSIFAHRDVKVAFDNFSVNSGRLSCP